MKYLLTLILALVCGSVSGAIGGGSPIGPPPSSGGVNPTGSGAALTNLPTDKLVVVTTNSVYDVTVGYSSGFTTAKNAASETIDVSSYNSKQWFVKQTNPLILTNSVLPPAYWFWSTNNFQELAPCWSFYTNLDVSSDCWAFMDGGNSLFTNGLAVFASAQWISGDGIVTYSDGIFQFKTNSSVSYSPVKVVLNEKTNATFELLGPNGGIEYTNTGTAQFLNFISLGASHFNLNFASAFGDIGGATSYGNIALWPDHSGSPSFANSEAIFTFNRIAIAGNQLQFGIAGINPGVSYIYHQYSGTGGVLGSGLNNSLPEFFRTRGMIGSVNAQYHYPGFYSVYVTTNAPSGTYYWALAYKQNTGFDAEDGTPYSIDRTNETFRAWGGNSAEFEVLVPTSGATNHTSKWPTSARSHGGYAIVNSNATVYILTSTPNSTAWAATNKIAGP